MAKREVVVNIDVDAPRPKRRKDVHVEEAPTKEEEDDNDVEMGDGAGGSSEREDDEDGEDEGAEVELSVEEVREKGLQVWHAVKNAVNKEGRSLSFDFQRLPSKRQYGDYYKQILQPISLEEIKNKLDRQEYTSISEVRGDFELMSKNARSYNVRESQIWKDAKSLQKIANKEIDKQLRGNDEGESDGEGGKKKKEKKPNLPRLLKNRLNKLIDLKDENGYSRTDLFLELPSKKHYPDYYQFIKRPICFNDIHRRIKQKGYSNLQEFMDDVDLVFDNAMTYNTDESPIYINAFHSKSYFHTMMSDLPKHFTEKYPLPASAAPAQRNKITLKLPGLHQPSTATGSAPVQSNGASGSGTTVRLRVPALNGGVSAGQPSNVAESSSTALMSPSSSHSGAKPVAPETSKSPKAKLRSPAVAHATVPKAISLPAAAAAISAAPVNQQSPKPAARAPAVPLANSNAPNTAAAATTPAMARTIHQTLPPPSLPHQGKNASTFQQYQPAQQPQYAQYSAGGAFASQHFYQTPQQTHSRTTAVKPVAPAPITPAPATRSSATLPIATPMMASLPGPSASQPPVPRVLSDPGMRSVRIVTQPLGRALILDSTEGVRSWAVRLGGGESGETRIVVRDVRFAGREREREGLEGSEVEEGEGATADEMEVDEEEGAGLQEDESVIVVAATPKRKRGRGRPRKNVAAAVAARKANGKQKAAGVQSSPSSAAKSSPVSAAKGRDSSSAVVPAVDEVLVKFGGLTISPKDISDSSGKDGEWEIEVGPGRHTLEIGKKGNSAFWKVFIDRQAQ